MDVLLPRMAVLGAQREDIIVLNFGVWIDHEQAAPSSYKGMAKHLGPSVKLETRSVVILRPVRQAGLPPRSPFRRQHVMREPGGF